jgi:hypothetical protein
MSVAVAGIGAAPGAAAVVDGAGTDADGLGGSDDDEVGAVHAPDITHHNTNTNAPMAITLIKSRSIVASTLGAQPDTVPKNLCATRALRSRPLPPPYRDQLAGGSCSAVGHKGRGLRFDPGLHAKAAQRHARQESAGRAGAQVRRIETLTDASMAMRRDLAHHHRLFDLICAERSA